MSFPAPLSMLQPKIEVVKTSAQPFGPKPNALSNPGTRLKLGRGPDLAQNTGVGIELRVKQIRAWRESNPQPFGPKPNALSSWATGAKFIQKRQTITPFTISEKKIFPKNSSNKAQDQNMFG